VKSSAGLREGSQSRARQSVGSFPLLRMGGKRRCEQAQDESDNASHGTKSHVLSSPPASFSGRRGRYVTLPPPVCSGVQVVLDPLTHQGTHRGVRC